MIGTRTLNGSGLGRWTQASWVFNLAVLGLIAYFLASGTSWLLSTRLVDEPGENVTVAAAVAPPRVERRSAKTRPPPRSGAAICSQNIFDYENRPCTGPPEEPEPEPVDEDTGDPEPCEVEAELVGTVTSAVEGYSFAMIESEGKTMPYRTGDHVEGLGTVEAIGWRLVLMDRQGEPDCLLDVFGERNKSGSAQNRRRNRRRRRVSKRRRQRRERNKEIREGIDVVSATERNVDRGLVDKLMDDPSQLMRRVRVRPYSEDGKITGFRLYRIRRNSLWGRLGLRNGDVVQSINGIDITSADRALAAYTKLRHTDRLTVSVKRRNRHLNLDFNIR